MDRACALRLSVLLIPLAVVAACSSASYEAPIARFAVASEAAESALVKLNNGIGEAYWNAQKDRIVAGEFRLAPSRDLAGGADCIGGAARCRLVMIDSAGKSTPFTEMAPLDNAIDVMAGIRSYAGGLAAIVAADTAKAVEGHVNATIGGLQKLAKTLGNPAKPVPDFTTPVGQLVNWAIGQYVETVKLSGLRRAVGDARSVVADAARIFGEAAVLASSATREALANEVTEAQKAMRRIEGAGPITRAQIDRSLVAARSFDEFVQADPRKAFAALGAAHEALAEHLLSEKVTFASASAAIENFVGEAEKLLKAAKQIEALLNPKPKE